MSMSQYDDRVGIHNLPTAKEQAENIADQCIGRTCRENKSGGREGKSRVLSRRRHCEETLERLIGKGLAYRQLPEGAA